MKKLILFSILNGLILGVFGQSRDGEDIRLPEIFPQSPTAAELGKFGSYPVNLSTGLPQISIPLYTVQSGDITIPITLKYHASGIKVSQTSSWVGLGWSLDTGGLINLEVRDTPDELETYIDFYDLPDVQELQRVFSENPYRFQSPEVSYITENSWVKDAYHINLPTVSGSFFLDSADSGEVTAKFPPDQYKVFKGSVNSEGYLYKLIDKNGVKYYFNETEEARINKSTADGSYLYNKNYTSAWLLSEIEDSKGNTVNYQYGETHEYRTNGQSHSQSFSLTKSKESLSVSTVIHYSHSINQAQTSSTSSTSYANKLKQITFKNGRIRFVIGRDNLYEGVNAGAGKFLEKIIIESGNATIGYEELKTIHFDYSTTGQGALPTVGVNPLTDKYRFKLDRVYETSPNMAISFKNLAEFEYSSVELPESGSYAIDYFGMYNGKNNSNLIPKRGIFLRLSEFSYDIREVGSADRSIDEATMEAGMLKKIIHPTKGYTKFEYEPNSYYGLYKNIPDEYISTSMILTGSTDGKEDPTIPCIDVCGPDKKYYNASIEESTSLIIRSLITISPHISNTKYHYGKISVYNNGDLQYTSSAHNHIYKLINLSKGDLQVVLEVYGNSITASVEISYLKKTPEVNQNIKGFGLRIKEIANHDDDDNLITKKEYDYTYPTNNNSSGKLNNNNSKYNLETSLQHFTQGSCMTIGGGLYSDTTTKTYLSSSRSGFESNSINYEYVTEIQKDSLDNFNGKTIHKYTSYPDVVVDRTENVLRTNNASKRGQLLKKEIFDINNNLVLKEDNVYSNESSVLSVRNEFKAFKYKSASVSSTNPSSEAICAFPPYTLSTAIELYNPRLGMYWYKKDSTLVTNYFYNAEGVLLDSLKNSTNYTYNLDNQELKEIITTNSNEGQQKTKTYYAHDLNDAQLLLENRIAEPLKVESYQDDTLLSTQETTYSTFEDLYLPKFIKTLIGTVSTTNNLEERIVYDDYNTNGNPIEVSKTDGSHTIYIWGYNEQYPIGKIDNATYEGMPRTVLTAIGNIKTKSNDENSEAEETELRSLFESLRSNSYFANSMLTSYTYDPLVGVTSTTDPKGYTMYYEYDDFQRLIAVKDAEGNLVSTNDYNYKN